MNGFFDVVAIVGILEGGGGCRAWNSNASNDPSCIFVPRDDLVGEGDSLRIILDGEGLVGVSESRRCRFASGLHDAEAPPGCATRLRFIDDARVDGRVTSTTGVSRFVGDGMLLPGRRGLDILAIVIEVRQEWNARPAKAGERLRHVHLHDQVNHTKGRLNRLHCTLEPVTAYLTAPELLALLLQ